MAHTKRTLALLLASILILLQCTVYIAAAQDEEDPEQVTFTISAETNRLRKKKTLQLYADTNADLSWSSSDTNVAEVDQNGLVTGISFGHAHITATDPASGASDTFKVFVVRGNAPWRTLLEGNAVLGYRYSFEDDYYYTDDLNCWQKFFGFNFAYDSIAPLMLFEYDYSRAFFNYGGKDWMIQMWKGQYGMVFYGAEVGIYNKPEGKETATRVSHYSAAQEEDFLKIGTALYRKNYSTGEYNLEYETPYAPHWWATGFVPGHLLDTTPCSELRLVTHITLKDEEMAAKFTDALTECGFRSVPDQDKVKEDTFFLDGKDVYLQWQNLSQAANSHVVQATFWSFVGFNGLILGFLLLLTMLFFGGFGLLLIFLI